MVIVASVVGALKCPIQALLVVFSFFPVFVFFSSFFMFFSFLRAHYSSARGTTIWALGAPNTTTKSTSSTSAPALVLRKKEKAKKLKTLLVVC